MQTPPTQNEIDQLATFLEAAEELKNEPFFHPDENRSVQTQGDKYTFVLGDRFHFRSALVTFRRIWMKSEPSNFHSCANILWRCHPQIQPGLLQSWRADVKRITKDRAIPFMRKSAQNGPTNEEIIDLWLYAVFAHVSVGKNGDKRKKFEVCLETYGQAPMEYAFRMAIFWLSMPYRNMSDHNVRPFLAHWWQRGLQPSFKIGAPFGVKLSEVTPDGHTLIRKSSSKFYNEETIERMFERVCSRHSNSNIKSFLNALDLGTSEKLKLVLWCDKVEEIVESSEKELSIQSIVPEVPHGPNFRGMFSLFDLPTQKVSKVFVEEGRLTTDLVGTELLNQSLQELKKQLKKESQDTNLR